LSDEDIKETSSLAELCSTPKQAFQECFQNWKKCWQQCLKSGGEYFEGDKAQQLQSDKTIYLKCSESLGTHLIYSKLLHFGTLQPYKLTQ
jgi:hypothetical protein